MSFVTQFLPLFYNKGGETTMANSIFRKQDGNIVLNVPYCEFYIPLSYFDETKQFATDYNSYIKTLGVFNVGIFENGKLKELKILNLPTIIDINVYDSEIREVTMSNKETAQCKVVKYLKDAKIMKDAIFQDDEPVKAYLNYILSGKIPTLIPYSKQLRVWKKNQDLNGVNFGVSSIYLELVLSVVNRNPEKLNEKFSQAVGENGIGDYDYKYASVRQICQYNSTFTALTFEDIDSMITSSLNKSRNRVKERESPIEQIIKF